MKDKIIKGSKWEMTWASDEESIQKLFDEGWEPFNVRKGDFVISGFSLGWLFASYTVCFKRPI